MQTIRTVMIGFALGSILIAASTVCAQSPDITAFSGNGVLTWTNSNTNLFYHVQWAASLSGTGVWRSSYATMQDIQSTNVTVSVPVPMFYRVQGSSNRVVNPAPVARTGQTPTVPFVAPEGSDGVLQKGVALPTPRFVDNANGTVTDQKTGLIWLKNASAFGGRDWGQALTDCNTLTNGMYGLTDGSAAGDWRLPNVEELRSLTAFQYSNPALTDTTGTGQWTEGQPFTGVQSDLYWSSTTEAGRSDYAWYVLLTGGQMYPDHKSHTYYVWPVRGGQ